MTSLGMNACVISRDNDIFSLSKTLEARYETTKSVFELDKNLYSEW